MEREELLRSKEYWITQIQMGLFEVINNYLKENKLTQSQFADKIGVNKSYITQILKGDFDHRISKLVELALACNIAPVFSFANLDDHIAEETKPRRLNPSKLSKPHPRGEILASKSQPKRKVRA